MPAKIKATTEWFKADPVMSYLRKKKSAGATNFEMIVALRLCDIRKRISVLRQRLAEINPDWRIIDIWLEPETEGKHSYKRYFLVHEDSNETKRIAKFRQKRSYPRKR